MHLPGPDDRPALAKGNRRRGVSGHIRRPVSLVTGFAGGSPASGFTFPPEPPSATARTDTAGPELANIDGLSDYATGAHAKARRVVQNQQTIWEYVERRTRLYEIG